MRLATWNVNSIRARVDRVIAFLERADIDVLAMQETKCKESAFPATPFLEAGYQVEAIGFSQWNGVAIASRVGLDGVTRGFPGQPEYGDPPAIEARAIGATCGSVEVWSLYVPHGRALDNPHYQYKLAWLAALADYAAPMATRPVALVGDFNVAPLDTDVWDPAVFEGLTHVSPPERAAFAHFADIGYEEVTRRELPGEHVYTYWDYQQLRFPKNEGMRIDFAYCSAPLASRVAEVSIERVERKGKGPSDHVPVVLTIDS